MVLPTMFLIFSNDMLCSVHESSILSCPQAPAGHGALRAGGCAFFFSRTRRRNRARAAARGRRAIQRPLPVLGLGGAPISPRLAEPRRKSPLPNQPGGRYS